MVPTSTTWENDASYERITGIESRCCAGRQLHYRQYTAAQTGSWHGCARSDCSPRYSWLDYDTFVLKLDPGCRRTTWVFLLCTGWSSSRAHAWRTGTLRRVVLILYTIYDWLHPKMLEYTLIRIECPPLGIRCLPAPACLPLSPALEQEPIDLRQEADAIYSAFQQSLCRDIVFEVGLEPLTWVGASCATTVAVTATCIVVGDFAKSRGEMFEYLLRISLRSVSWPYLKERKCNSTVRIVLVTNGWHTRWRREAAKGENKAGRRKIGLPTFSWEHSVGLRALLRV